jgi:hypothetical protein
MKVKALTSSFANAPEEVLQAGWFKECELDITAGREYVVHAISFFGEPEYGRPRLLTLQIVGDSNVVSWFPAFLFSVVERALPADWEGNLFSSGTFVLGPPFVVESEEAYRAMVELEPEPMQKFRARQHLADLEFPTDDISRKAIALEGKWVQCAVCSDAWESESCLALVRCPSCASVLINPRAPEREESS